MKRRTAVVTLGTFGCAVAFIVAACGGGPRPKPVVLAPVQESKPDASSSDDAGGAPEAPKVNAPPCVHLGRRKPNVPNVELATIAIKRQADTCSVETKLTKAAQGQAPPPEECGTDALSKVLSNACAIGGEYVYGLGQPATEFRVGKYTRLDEGADVRTICDAPKKKPAAKADLTPKARAHFYASAVEDDITTPNWRGFIRSAGVKGLKASASELRDAAKTFRVAKCALADEWDALPSETDAP